MSHLQTNLKQSCVVTKIKKEFFHQFDCDHQDYKVYPEPNWYVEAFDMQAYTAWVSNRNIGTNHRALSLYVHIPFCHSLCFYCRYNQVITNDQIDIERYLEYLLKEIRIKGRLFQDDPKVEQIYFGGGTPTILNSSQLACVMDEIKENFDLIQNGECLIEIDPRLVACTDLKKFLKLGFNHVVLSVQDFAQHVQQAVHRFQSEEETLNIIEAARQEGFKSVRIELIYGLPKQSVEDFNNTLGKVISASPDQVNLLNYLHFPDKFKPQRCIDTADLPLIETRREIMQLAVSHLTQAGYTHIGMSLFARHEDQLVKAQRQGLLHYNLQGYSIFPGKNLVALGASAIGSVGPTISQNHYDLKQYYDKLSRDQLPIMRGLELNADDLLRRSVIHALICHSIFSFESVETTFQINFKQYFATELLELLTYEKAGLLALSDEEIVVTPEGRLLISSICKVFDKYLRLSQAHSHYAEVF